jgi:Ni/Co efflux regulator RcnB
LKKYQKDAQNRYNSKFDIVQARLPKGTKERIQSLDYTINAFIVEAVETMLKSFETPTAPILEPTESVSTEKETKEVGQMPSAEVMPWEEGFVDPLSESEEEKRKEKIAKFLARKHGDAINDVIIQESIRSDYGMDMLIKANWYVEHPEALEEPDQENKPQEKGIQSIEELNEELAKKRAEDAAKISAEEEQRKNRLKEIQEATKNDIVNYVKRVRNGSEMTEEERKKEAEREEWKKKNNKEFCI